MTEQQERDQKFDEWWRAMGASKAIRVLSLCPTGYPSESEVKRQVREIWNDSWEACMEIMVNR